MRIALAIFLVSAFGLFGCSGHNAPTAVIRVDPVVQTAVNGAEPVAQLTQADQDACFNVLQVYLRSSGCLRPVMEHVGLAKVGEKGDVEMLSRLQKAVHLGLGKEPGTYVVELQGFERDTAVKVVNAICESFVTARWGVRQRQDGSSVGIRAEILRKAE